MQSLIKTAFFLAATTANAIQLGQVSYYTDATCSGESPVVIPVGSGAACTQLDTAKSVSFNCGTSTASSYAASSTCTGTPASTLFSACTAVPEQTYKQKFSCKEYPNSQVIKVSMGTTCTGGVITGKTTEMLFLADGNCHRFVDTKTESAALGSYYVQVTDLELKFSIYSTYDCKGEVLREISSTLSTCAAIPNPFTTAPTKAPTAAPTTKSPTTTSPTKSPTTPTTLAPTATPTTPTTSAPTTPTTHAPTKSPSKSPITSAPSKSPSKAPITSAPSQSPSKSPNTSAPSKSPSRSPSKSPVTSAPSQSPSKSPITSAPSTSPSKSPITSAPSTSPSKSPITSAPSARPSTTPSQHPATSAPTVEVRRILQSSDQISFRAEPLVTGATIGNTGPAPTSAPVAAPKGSDAVTTSAQSVTLLAMVLVAMVMTMI